MAFKLVDDPNSNHCRLKQKQRGEEVVYETIPRYEYIKNRSGKLACKVCPNWPVFDTVQMLSIHRQGRKHEENARQLKRMKEEQQWDNLKNTQETELKTTLNNKELFSKTARKERHRFGRKCHPALRPCKRKKIIDVDTPDDDTVKLDGEVDCSQEVDSIANYANYTNYAERCVTPCQVMNLAQGESSGASTQSKSPRIPSASEREAALRDKKLRESGWILVDGKRCKDENCEFDTDDEESDIYS